LGELHTAGENAAEYLILFKSLSWKTTWKVYLCNFGILDTLSQLLIKVCCVAISFLLHYSAYHRLFL